MRSDRGTPCRKIDSSQPAMASPPRRMLTRARGAHPAATEGLMHETQGNHPGWRARNPAAPPDACDIKTVAAGLRQAADLLSPDHADAGGHPGISDHHDTRGSRSVQAPA